MLCFVTNTYLTYGGSKHRNLRPPVTTAACSGRPEAPAATFASIEDTAFYPICVASVARAHI